MWLCVGWSLRCSRSAAFAFTPGPVGGPTGPFPLQHRIHLPHSALPQSPTQKHQAPWPCFGRTRGTPACLNCYQLAPPASQGNTQAGRSDLPLSHIPHPAFPLFYLLCLHVAARDGSCPGSSCSQAGYCFTTRYTNHCAKETGALSWPDSEGQPAWQRRPEKPDGGSQPMVLSSIQNGRPWQTRTQR